MAHVGVETVILLPLLILQIMVFPYATNMMTSYWADTRKRASLQNAGDQLGSTIQQLYSILIDEDVQPGVVIQIPDVPSSIESYRYTVSGALENSSSTAVLTLSLLIPETGIATTTKVTFGPQVGWQESVFESSLPNAHIKATKFDDGSLLFCFGGAE